MKENLIWITPEIKCFKYNEAEKLFNAISLKKKEQLNKFYFVYIKPNSKEVKKSNNFFSNIKFIENSFHIIKIIESSKFTYIFIDGFRFVDLLIVKYLNSKKYLKNKFKFVYIQHGRYTKLKRKITISNHYLKKSFFYLSFLIRTIFYDPKSIRVFLSSKYAYIDFGFIYKPKAYWVKYHSNMRMVFKDHQEIGDKDFDKFKIKNEDPRDKILYLSQTLVEDTRCNLIDQLNFSENLKYLSSNFKLGLEIKPHPRSDLNLLRKQFKNHYFLDDESKEFENYKIIITHNSSLAMFFLENNVPVIFYKLTNEKLPLGLDDHPFSYQADCKEKISKIIKKILEREIKIKLDDAFSQQKPGPKSIFKYINLFI